MIDTTTIYHYLITGFNVFILTSLVVSFVRHFKARKDDRNFHTLMLLLCTLLLLANTFAFITSFYAYWIIKMHSPEILQFGRFADRYCMFFSYLVLGKIMNRYK